MARRGAAGRPDAVEAAADELYGLPLDEFTAARNERAKQARAQGDGEAAAAIGKLAKPNTVAWLANQLVRKHAQEIGRLRGLGESMRRATALLDASQLRQLSRQQHQVVYALVQQARGLATGAGQAVSDSTARGLADTLHAALADEQAAGQLSEGRLTAGLSRSGFPGIDATSQAVAAAVDRRAQRRKPAATDAARREQAEQAEQARRDEAEARSDVGDAAQAREQAQATLTRAGHAAREAADTVDRLKAELDAAVAARADADGAVRHARKDADWADRAARQAERRLQNATARRENLER